MQPYSLFAIEIGIVIAFSILISPKVQRHLEYRTALDLLVIALL